MEEDAGKSIHDRYAGVTAIDLNRCGVPLIEIVSEPDLRSPAEAGALPARAQADARVPRASATRTWRKGACASTPTSARAGTARPALGTKTEIKNMNSFSGVERALEAEFARQCELLDRGEPVVQQTMLWDGARGEVRPARGKEGSHDYRYFPEPDLPPLRRSPERIDQERRATSRASRRAPRALRTCSMRCRCRTSTCSPRTAASPTTSRPSVAPAAMPRRPRNWVMGEVLAWLNDTGTGFATFSVARAGPRGRCSTWCATGTLSHSAARADLREHGSRRRDAGRHRGARGPRASGRRRDPRRAGWMRSSSRMPAEAASVRRRREEAPRRAGRGW